MGNRLPQPMGGDPGFVAEIAELEKRVGSVYPAVIEARWHLHLQAQRCAAGDHVYAWTGQIVDLPGGSPHQVMACAYSALHAEGNPSPKRIGPLHTPENAAKHLWSEQELKESAPPS